MKTVALAWELGANLGHIDRLLGVAEHLKQQGFHTVFILRDLARCHSRLVLKGHEVIQAPVWLPPVRNPPRTTNYAGVLVNSGWLSATGLASLVAGWQAIFDRLRPALLLADHSPAALLASRHRGFPVCAIGNSWEIPPVREYFPAIESWNPEAVAYEKQSDELVLAAVNRSLSLLGQAPLDRLTDLFRLDEIFLCSLPELTHYDNKLYGPDFHLHGPSFIGHQGIEPSWPSGHEVRVFCYLEPTHANFEPLLAALEKLQFSALIHAKGITETLRSRFGKPNIRFLDEPVKMARAALEADILVSHASLGTVSAGVLGGCAHLVFPTHTEQSLVARRIHEQGIGAGFSEKTSAEQLTGVLRKLSTDTALHQRVRALASHHAGISPLDTGRGIARRCLELLGSTPRSEG